MRVQLLTRGEFRRLWNSYGPGLGEWGSPLWIPDYTTGKKSRHFVSIPPVVDDYEFKFWTIKHCSGQVLCYSVDESRGISWYGFSHHADIPLFILRWS